MTVSPIYGGSLKRNGIAAVGDCGTNIATEMIATPNACDRA